MNHSAMIEHFKALMRKKCEERDEHQELVRHPLGPRFGHTVARWHLREMELLLAEINRLRLEANQNAVTAEELARAELCATGHVDYAQKLAIYATELVEGRPNPGAY